MSYTNPQPSDFEAWFVRDFPYGTDPNVSVLQQDIANAMLMTNATINPAMWDNQQNYNIGYLLLSAHFLVLNLRASSQGINGQYNFLQNSKAVGSVNEAFEIPERLKNNPDLMQYFKTNYGAQYMGLLWPQICGPYNVAMGRTHA